MYLHNIIHRHCAWLIATIASIALFTACTPDKGINANLFAIQPEALTIVEGETATITVSGGTDFDISTDNSNATCVKNSDATISVTGLKVGTCTLTVTKGNESLSCKITIERSAAQKDFLIYATPRVENWLAETLNTETTPGLQVSCEKVSTHRDGNAMITPPPTVSISLRPANSCDFRPKATSRQEAH